MREVYTNPDFTRVGYYKSVLDEAGVSSFVRNENAIGAVGAAFPPSLCVTVDSDYDEAIRVIKTRQFIESVPRSDWKCPSCREENPGNFELCWNCGALGPKQPAA
jgi:hypothetical protein